MIRSTGYKPAFYISRTSLECGLVLLHYGYTPGILPLVIFIRTHTSSRDYKALKSHVIP